MSPLFMFSFCSKLYHLNNYGEPKSDKKVILLFLIFCPFFGDWQVCMKWGGALQRPQFLALAMVDIVHRAPESLCYVDHCKCTYKQYQRRVTLEPRDPVDPSFRGLSKFQLLSPAGSTTFSICLMVCNQMGRKKLSFSLSLLSQFFLFMWTALSRAPSYKG